ncbi:MAG: hypothetical protein EXR69_04940 [Myxococcales bacterium]|nr:hypothetical protein [Myxococcales bacterium]
MQFPQWLRTLLRRLGATPPQRIIAHSVVQWSREAPDAVWHRHPIHAGRPLRLSPLGGFTLVDGDSDRV